MKKEIPVHDINYSCETSIITSFKVKALQNGQCPFSEFTESHKNDFFEIIWLKDGEGIHEIDLHKHFYKGSVLFILAPGQIHSIHPDKISDGYVLRFQPSLFKNEKEFADYVLDSCLFDTVSSCPIIPVAVILEPLFESIFHQMVTEFNDPQMDSENIFSSYLKVLITNIHRIKRAKTGSEIIINNPHYSLFRAFKLAVEKEYKQEHSVQYYASLLNTQTRTLNMVSQKFGGKSAGDVIQERIVLEAKRGLYHQYLSIKELGFSLGFEDPAYFTRFFKKHTDFSPQQFKESQVKV
nr:helix-turn-helix domain-containing protein [uncultured Flavobacterium sp.]